MAAMKMSSGRNANTKRRIRETTSDTKTKSTKNTGANKIQTRMMCGRTRMFPSYSRRIYSQRHQQRQTLMAFRKKRGLVKKHERHPGTDHDLLPEDAVTDHGNDVAHGPRHGAHHDAGLHLAEAAVLHAVMGIGTAAIVIGDRIHEIVTGVMEDVMGVIVIVIVMGTTDVTMTGGGV